VVFQITVGELNYKRSISTLDMISSFGVPVVLGTDAHNMTSRAPHFDLVSQKLSEKAGLFGKSLKKTHAIIENCLYAQSDVEKLIRTPKQAEVK